MSEVRKEKDSLGFVEVPARAYYGAQTARAVENYPISGLNAHPQLIRAFGMVKRAAAEANEELGLVDDKRADAIIQAAQEVIDGKWDAEFVVDVFQAGAGVSLHMNTNEVIANRANEILGGNLGDYAHVHPNDHVNYGQSTNDVFPTGMRLATLLTLDTLYPVLDALAATFAAKAKEFHGIMKSGRTHMQDAVPIRLGQEFAAYGLAIEKGEIPCVGFRDPARAGAGRQRRRHRHQYPPRLPRQGHCKPRAHLRPEVHAGRGHALGHAIERLHGRCERGSARHCAGDHPHLERHSPALLRAQYRLRGDLSSQPAAGLVHHARQDQPCYAGIGRHGQLPGDWQRYGRGLRRPGRTAGAQRDDAHHGPQRSAEHHHPGQHARQFDDRCVAGITANAERCNFYAQSTVSLATALNPYIGYAKAAEIVKESVATGESIIEIARARKLLSEEEIAEILDPVRMTEPQYPLEAAKERDKAVTA